MSTLREYVSKLHRMMNFMVLDIPDGTNKEELLVTMETDNVERLQRLLEQDRAKRMWPIQAVPPEPEDLEVVAPGVVSPMNVGNAVVTASGSTSSDDPTTCSSTSSTCSPEEVVTDRTSALVVLPVDDDEDEDQEDRRRMFCIWRSTSNDVEEDGKHLQFVTGSTLLHIAAKYGAIKNVNALLSTPGFHPNMYIADYGGALPLHWAVAGNRPQVVDRLIKAGSRINVGDVLGRTALHIACSKGNLGCVKALLQVPDLDLNSRDPDGFTALISTMLRQRRYYHREVNGKPNTARHVEIMRLLITAGADLNFVAKSGFSALHLAVHLADIEPFIDCLLDSDVNIDQRISSGNTTISTPCSGGGYHDCSNIYGPTPLWFAIAGGHLVAACKLILANADLEVCCRKQSVSSMDQLNALPKRDVFAEMVLQFTSRDYLGVRPLDSMALCVDTTFEKVMTPFGIAITHDLFHFAFDIVQSGFAMSQHDQEWFQSRLERLALTELPELLMKARTGRVLLAELISVRSLQWWCRRCIRKWLPSGFSRLETAVGSLDLPSKMKDYLLLKDVFINAQVRDEKTGAPKSPLLQ